MRKGSVLLIIMIVLACLCPVHIYHDKKKVEDIQSGKLVIANTLQGICVFMDYALWHC